MAKLYFHLEQWFSIVRPSLPFSRGICPSKENSGPTRSRLGIYWAGARALTQEWAPLTRSYRQMAPSGGLLPSAVWARWTVRGGGNQKRPVVAARWFPTPCTQPQGWGAGGWASCVLSSAPLSASLRARPPLRSARSRPPWRRRHKVSGHSPIALRVSSGARRKVFFGII